ncbi:MAG: sigma-70 family RNA polymerase sigma factor [Prevotella sp.]|nr:sigma-70 family RNA polymerase sigma factor [Prevotella sp.]
MSNQELITNYYVAHRDELLAVVSSRLRGSSEAEDMVQDVFLRLLSTDKMITETTLHGLVYTMVRNLIIDYYRRHTSYQQYEHYIKDVCSDTTTMESVFSVREIMEQMERGLARLPKNCREVYRLHIYGGMKVGEISQKTGEGYKSVEHRLGTARKAMRQYLRKYA